MKLYLALLAVTVTLHIPSQYRGVTGALKNTHSLCTGVVIAPDLVLTAQHCVEDSTGLVIVEDSKGRMTEGIPVREDKSLDLALIRVKLHYSHSSRLGKEPSITDRVYNVNSGGGMENTYGEGFIQNIDKDDELDNHKMIYSSIKIETGASGSGLFNQKGQLIGIQTITHEIGSMAVDLETIKAFLNGPTPLPKKS